MVLVARELELHKSGMVRQEVQWVVVQLKCKIISKVFFEFNGEIKLPSIPGSPFAPGRPSDPSFPGSPRGPGGPRGETPQPQHSPPLVDAARVLRGPLLGAERTCVLVT